MSNGRLSPRQQRFCAEYLLDMNATAAAKRAGYSEATAKQQGSRLLTNVDVIARVAELQAQVQERIDITVDDVVRMLQEAAKEAKLANQFGPMVRAIELLGKRLGMFKDRVLVTEVQALSDEQLFERISGGDPKRLAMARELLGAPDSFDTAKTQH